MDTAMLIRKHINKLPADRIFTTREVLHYGSRAAVDSVLSRLVNIGMIYRIARGVFVRDGCTKWTPLDVARIKAEAFGKTVATHARDLAHRLGLVQSGNSATTLYVDGCSSSFKTESGVTIYLKGISARKRRLTAASKVGEAILALWTVKHTVGSKRR